MNWEIILDFALTVVLIVLARYVVPYLQATLKAKDKEELILLVEDLVAAAEQVFKGTGMGQKKKAYVIEALSKAGHAIDGEVDAMIEATVYRLPEE